jgi:hypothetical protein
MAISKRRMTATDFEAVRPLLRISEERINAARAALVDGRTHQEIAAPHGWTRQAVNDSVTAVWRVLSDYRKAQAKSAGAGLLLPPGWEQVTLIAPKALIEKFRAEIALYADPAPIAHGSRTKKTKRAALPRAHS